MACHTGQVTAAVPDVQRAEIVDVLRRAGARFALLHGSRATGIHRPASDVDVAAWWVADAPASFEVLVPPGVDLVVLNGAPLELAGRIVLARLADPSDLGAFVSAMTEWLHTPR